MKRYYYILFFTVLLSCISSNPAIGQYLEGASFLSNTPASLMSGFSSRAKYNVDAYKIRYYTTDIDGTQTIASGALLIPLTNACDSFPLAVYDHGTVLEKENVPSRDNFEALVAKVLASTGAVAVAPDYLGLGDNPGLHPYVHANSEATATIDLIRAAREFIRDSLSLSLNSEVYLTGYSQGGHAAMATGQYIEENALFNEFNVIGAGPASGPYNLSSTMLPLILSNAPYSNPGYITYLLFGMQRVYGNLYQSYSDILDSPYDTLIPPLFDGTVDMNVVNAALPAIVRDFIQDSVLDNIIADSISQNHPITRALLDNDNYDWNPSFDMELYYCTLDEQVDYQNSLDAEAAMMALGANVTAVNRGSLNHGGCFIPALQGALAHFESLKTFCQSVGYVEISSDLISIYPQPATTEIRVEGAEGKQILVYGLNGRLIHQGQLNNEGILDIDNWPSGIYLLIIEKKIPLKFIKA